LLIADYGLLMEELSRPRLFNQQSAIKNQQWGLR